MTASSTVLGQGRNSRLPGETVYSVLARIRFCSGLSAKELLSLVSHRKKIRIHPWLPAFLTNLQQLGLGSRQQLLRFHTLYPLFNGFLDTQRGQLLKHAMYNHFPQKVVQQTLISNNHVRFPYRCYYCPQCALSDIARDGAAIWHRDHQIPGITVCKIHRVDLNFVPLLKCGWDDLKIVPIEKGQSPRCLDGDLGLARFGAELLECLSNISTEFDGNRAFRAKLDSLGGITQSGSLRRRVISAEFQDYLKGLRIGPEQSPTPPMRSIFRVLDPKQSCRQHVYHHLLVGNWLFPSGKELFKSGISRMKASGIEQPAGINGENTNLRNSHRKQSASVGIARHKGAGPEKHSELYGANTKIRVQKGEMTKVAFRKSLRAYMRTHPSASRTVIMKEMQREFYWLYRNDKKWLWKSLPVRLPIKQAEKVNWEVRDETLLSEVSLCIENSVRFANWTEVDRFFGGHGWFLKKRSLLPKTCEKLVANDVMSNLKAT